MTTLKRYMPRGGDRNFFFTRPTSSGDVSFTRHEVFLVGKAFACGAIGPTYR